MNLLIVWAVVAVIFYFRGAIMDFQKCDYGIKKEFLKATNRERWQRNRAIIRLSVAGFGCVLIFSKWFSTEKMLIVISGSAVLLLIILEAINDHILKK